MLPAQLIAEYQALQQTAGCGSLARSRIVLTGRDRATLLHKFCTQDVLGLTPGQGGEAFLCNVQGKIVGYVFFLVEEERIVLDSAPQQAEAIVKHLDRYVITEDVKFADASAATRCWLLAGPKSHEFVASLGTVGSEVYAHGALRAGAAEARAQRVPYGNDAYLIAAREQEAATIDDHLAQAGATLCSAEALEILRIEAGVPLYGTDITVENLPQEVNRDATAIHFRKGCYLGQETVARIDALGHVNKLLVRVAFSPDAAIAPGLELRFGEKTVGRVTSVCWSPARQAPLALAYVRREQANAGTRLASEMGDGEVV
jgi:folate-binding protein YgfZ